MSDISERTMSASQRDMVRTHVNTLDDTPQKTDHQQITFNDANTGDVLLYKDTTDPTFADGTSDIAGLGSFLERPVPIANYTWSSAGGVYLKHQDIAVWHLFANNPKIKNKLQNYSYLRGNLHLKLVVNGTPFCYGEIMAAYRPYTLYGLEKSVSQPLSAVPNKLYLNTISQRPHAYASINTSQGFEMKLPFISKKNAIRVANLQEFESMGALDLISLTPLLRVSKGAGETTISMTLYAWMSDVSLYGLTDVAALSEDLMPQCMPFSGRARRLMIRDIKRKLNRLVDKVWEDDPYDSISVDVEGGSSLSSHALPQSSFKTAADNVGRGMAWVTGTEDEYGKAPVSTTADNVSTMAGWVGWLIPPLKPFMLATQVAAESSAEVARSYGYSDPVVLSNVMPFKDMPFHSLASPEISDPTAKLTLDPKNELTVDSRTVGLDGTDELTVASLVTRRTYLDAYSWKPADSRGTQLAAVACEPGVKSTNARTGYVEIQRTPFSHVAHMFKYWRGDIQLTIKIVASNFHRGRLLLSWENQDSSSVDQVTQLSKVIDISVDREVTITAPWLNDNMWKQSRRDNTTNEYYQMGSAPLAFDDIYRNGIITLSVETELSSPDDSDDAIILFYFNAGDNTQFAAPIGPSVKLSSRAPTQSGELSSFADVQSTPAVGTPVADEHKSLAFANPSDKRDLIGMVTMGETVKSLRPLMRRMVHLFRRIEAQESPANEYRVYNWNQPRQIPLPGYDPVGLNVDTSARRYNFVNWCPSSWMRICFLGERGSYRYKYNMMDEAAVGDMVIQRSRDGLFTSRFWDRYDSAVGGAATKEWYNNQRATGWGGMCLTNQLTQTGLSAEVPMYSRYRMLDTFKGAAGADYDESQTDGYNFRASALLSNTPRERCFDVYAGVGTDYNLFCFIGVPLVFALDTVPDPA